METAHPDAESEPLTSTAERRPDLDSRYGRTPRDRGRQRLLGWAAGLVIALTFVLWAVWTTFDNETTALEARDIGHSIVDDTTVSVTFEVSMAAGRTASCAVEAQNEAHAIAGWKIVEIPAADVFTRTVTTTVRTVEPAVTGLIYRCWLT